MKTFAIVLALIAIPTSALAQDDAVLAPLSIAPPPPSEPIADKPPRLAPVGRPAPPTEAATRGTGAWRAGLEIFASYTYQNLDKGDGRSWYHVFDLPRAHAAVEGEFEHVKGRLVLEATRSSADGSLVGVSGDSFVLRIREAYAAYRPIPLLEVSAGVIPTATIPELDGTWMMRAIAPSALESSGLASPADLGARIRLDLPRGFGNVSTSIYNGEGYTSRELNRGKNTELAAEIHPAPFKQLALFGSYVAGSSGTSKARADRVTGGAAWQAGRVRAGTFATYAIGVRDAAKQHALVLSAFARVEPYPRVLLGARADYFVRDTDAKPDDKLTTVLVSGGYRLADPLETFLILSRTIPTTAAEASLPGSDLYELRVVARVVF